jgi:hypothetical protein
MMRIGNAKLRISPILVASGATEVLELHPMLVGWPN